MLDFCADNWSDERKNRIVVIMLNKIFFIISLDKEPTSYDQDIPTISIRFNDTTVGNSKKWCWLNNYQSMCRLKTRTQHRNVKSDSYALDFIRVSPMCFDWRYQSPKCHLIFLWRGCRKTNFINSGHSVNKLSILSNLTNQIQQAERWRRNCTLVF